MDDTFWLASNREDMQKRVEMHWAWCQYNGIKMNIDKSTYTYVPRRGREKAEPPPPPQIGDKRAKVTHWDSYNKYLGIHLSPKGKTGHEQRRVEAKMLKILNQLEHKQLTVNEVKYVVNTVVGGVAQYTMRAIVLAPDMLKRIDTKIARVLKLKGKMGTTSNRNLLYYVFGDIINCVYYGQYSCALREYVCYALQLDSGALRCQLCALRDVSCVHYDMSVVHYEVSVVHYAVMHDTHK